MPKPRAGRRRDRRETWSRDRRRFIQLVGLAGATSALGGAGLALAQTGTKPPNEPAKPAPVPAPPATTEVPPEIVEDAKALVAILERRHGKHLDAEQLAAVERELQNRLRSGRALRAAKLGNHEEPDTVFRA